MLHQSLDAVNKPGKCVYDKVSIITGIGFLQHDLAFLIKVCFLYLCAECMMSLEALQNIALTSAKAVSSVGQLNRIINGFEITAVLI